MRGGVRVPGSRVLAIALLAASCGSSAASGGASSCQAACNRCASELCVDCAATSARLRNEFENAIYSCVLQGTILEAGLVAQAQQCLSQLCATISACFMPLFD